MTQPHISAIVLLAGCASTGIGLAVNIVLHTRRATNRRFITGRDVADEFVWWAINLGMFLIAWGIFWLVKPFVKGILR